MARRLGMENDEVEVIQSGNIFEAGDIIMNPMKNIVLKHYPKAELKRLDGVPVVGAVVLGMEAAGFDGYVVRDVILKTAKEIIK